MWIRGVQMAEFKFEFDFTKEKLRLSLSKYEGSIDDLYTIINSVLPKYRITSESRLAGFIDQYEHLTDGFKNLEKMKFKDSVAKRRFISYVQRPLDEIEKYCSTLEGAIDSAGWWWNMNYLNVVSDNFDVNNLTKRINPDEQNIEERKTNYFRIVSTLKGE